MSSRKPNSGTSGSSSPSPSPNSGENRETIAPQTEEVQADETVAKEEEQSVADSASREEEIRKLENPVEEIPKPENPDEKISKEENPEEENPDEEIPKQENPEAANPQKEVPPEGDALIAYLSNILPDFEMGEQRQLLEDFEVRKRQVQIVNQAQNPEIPQEANPHEEIPPEGGGLIAYLSNILPDFEMGEQRQLLEDFEVRKRQQVQIFNQAQNPEIPQEANPHEEIPPEGGGLIAYLSNILPDFEMGEQRQLLEDFEVRKRQQVQIANQAQNPEIPQEANPHEEIPPEGGGLIAYLSNILPDFEMGEQRQLLEDFEVRKRQQVQIVNQAQNPEIPQEANPNEEIPPEGGGLIAYLSNILPDFEMGEQRQMYHVIQAENRQQTPIANQAQNQEQVLHAVPISYYQSDNLEDYGFSSEDSDTFERENAELDAMYAENLANEPNRESGNRGQETPTIDSIQSIPIFEPNRGIGSGELDSPTIADIFREPENPMFSSIFPIAGWGIGNREREIPTTAASITPIEPNRGTGNTDPEDPTIAEISASVPRIRRLRVQMRRNPTIDATFDSGRQNPTIDAAFDSRPAINPNRGFAIRDPHNPTNNPAPAAVPAQQDKGKGKGKVRGREEDKNPRPTKMCRCISESRYLFPRSTSEEEDDITTLNSIIAYRRHQGPLASAESPENSDGLFAFITSHLPEGESISLETLKEKLALLPKKYVRLLRQREFLVNFQTMATHYDRQLYRLGEELWGDANAQDYQFPGGNVGTSGASGDGS